MISEGIEQFRFLETIPSTSNDTTWQQIQARLPKRYATIFKPPKFLRLWMLLLLWRESLWMCDGLWRKMKMKKRDREDRHTVGREREKKKDGNKEKWGGGESCVAYGVWEHIIAFIHETEPSHEATSIADSLLSLVLINVLSVGSLTVSNSEAEKTIWMQFNY